MKKLSIILLALTLSIGMQSCSEDDNNDPAPTLSGTIMQPNVGGPSQPDQVYIDLSSGDQNQINRSFWHLGFSSGSENRVVLNPAIEMLAYKTTKNDMSLVNSSDTVGLSEMLSLDAIFGALLMSQPPAWLANAKDWVDNPNGDLAETAIEEVVQNNLDNMVYIINSGKDENGIYGNWYKIKVDLDPNGYNFAFALIDEPNPTTHSITKDTDYNFEFFSFTNGFGNAEPMKSSWDICFSTYTELANFGFEVPYFYQDFVFHNRSDVEAVQLTFPDKDALYTAYESITINNTSALNFDEAINVIGSNWREVATPQPGTVTRVKDNIMYILKDADGKYYKLVFTDMMSDSGDRGYPEFIYKKLN